jgi:predicted nucleic acid-binding protein
VSDFVLDAAVALQWFLEDEGDRKYSLAVLASLSLTRLKALPIEAAQQASFEILELPALGQSHGLTNYDAAYLASFCVSSYP